MNHYSLVNKLRSVWLVVLLTCLSCMAAASEKNYTVTAPDGIRLAVQEAGNPDGPAIVFIHGLLGSRLNWEQQINSPVLQRYRMITYDMRGHGLSDKPDEVEAYRNGRYFADDLAAVLKATDARQPVLVGWSLGGAVISSYLAAYGDSNIGGALYADGVIELNSTLITPHPQVYAGMASDNLHTHLNAVRDFLRLCFYQQPDRATWERLLANAAMASWTLTRTIPTMTLAAAEGLSQAHMPILLLYGAKDELVNTEASIARTRQFNPRIEAQRYENSGHAPFLEETARFNQDLAAFVQKVAARRGQ
ncbi:alpha/beta fold hydrolase [[Erwinia] mediterraneensis]|uniref:alpha/beta fold hydrolase n=1 Tax=[Erwinia] mediterraneensis TaxID=2161819 RepID=UPI001030395E|nr:alpha/beta hydrolase [[Erwinia] mediterraneensis]